MLIQKGVPKEQIKNLIFIVTGMEGVFEIRKVKRPVKNRGNTK
jgi:hypothetical protein